MPDLDPLFPDPDPMIRIRIKIKMIRIHNTVTSDPGVWVESLNFIFISVFRISLILYADPELDLTKKNIFIIFFFSAPLFQKKKIFNRMIFL